MEVCSQAEPAESLELPRSTKPHISLTKELHAALEHFSFESYFTVPLKGEIRAGHAAVKAGKRFCF